VNIDDIILQEGSRAPMDPRIAPKEVDAVPIGKKTFAGEEPDGNGHGEGVQRMDGCGPCCAPFTKTLV